jgi:hypothetical protein
VDLPPPPPPPEPWLRVPVGQDAERWSTIRCERTILVVVRTITTVSWLFDVLPELLGDSRIQILFTLNGNGSAYEAGVVDAVRDLGGRVVPWEQAVATPFDLAIAASYYGGLEQLSTPLLILPHGSEYAKRISHPSDGLAPLPVVAKPGIPRVTVAVAHEQGRTRWHEDPAKGQRVVVTGDQCFDRLEASHEERERYRRALGVDEDQRMVAISSTWGPNSLLGTCPALPADLLAEMPVDEYVVAAILHPNIWVGHGQWQVRLWLKRALEAGLKLVPYREGWRATLVAADSLIGDHGSVTFYGAALGVPTQLGAFADEEIVKDSATSALGQAAPHLVGDRSLRGQIDRLGFERDAGRYRTIVERAFAYRGEALERLRTVVYELIALDPPSFPVRVMPVPAPEPEGRAATAYLVTARLERDASGPEPRVIVERFPAGLEPMHTDGMAGRHLSVDASEPDRRLRESAAIIACNETAEANSGGAPYEAELWAISTLASFPGCLVVAAALDATRCLIAVRDQTMLEATADDPCDPGLIASAAYASLIAGEHANTLNDGLILSAGARERRVQLRSMPLETQPSAP